MTEDADDHGRGLRLRGLAGRRGDRRLFAGLDAGAAQGEALILRGPNGSGKTTLLRMLAGLLAPEAGRIEWGGADIANDRAAYREEVHYAGHAASLKGALSAQANLHFWARYLGGTADNVPHALDRMGVAHLAELPVSALSAGQQRRLSLARLLIAQRPLWLLDEPTVALDSDGQAQLDGLLKEHLDAGGVAVIATHAPLAVVGCVIDMADFAPDGHGLWTEAAW